MSNSIISDDLNVGQSSDTLEAHPRSLTLKSPRISGSGIISKSQVKCSLETEGTKHDVVAFLCVTCFSTLCRKCSQNHIMCSSRQITAENNFTEIDRQGVRYRDVNFDLIRAQNEICDKKCENCKNKLQEYSSLLERTYDAILILNRMYGKVTEEDYFISCGKLSQQMDDFKTSSEMLMNKVANELMQETKGKFFTEMVDSRINSTEIRALLSPPVNNTVFTDLNCKLKSCHQEFVTRSHKCLAITQQTLTKTLLDAVKEIANYRKESNDAASRHFLTEMNKLNRIEKALEWKIMTLPQNNCHTCDQRCLTSFVVDDIMPSNTQRLDNETSENCPIYLGTNFDNIVNKVQVDLTRDTSNVFRLYLYKNDKRGFTEATIKSLTFECGGHFINDDQSLGKCGVHKNAKITAILPHN